MAALLTTIIKINSYSLLFLLLAFVYANVLFLLARRRSVQTIFLFLLVLVVELGNVFMTFLTLNAGSDELFRIANEWVSFTTILGAPLFVTFVLAYTRRGKFLQTLQYMLFIFAPSLVMLFFAWNTTLLGDYTLSEATHTIFGSWVNLPQLGTVLYPLYKLLYAIIGVMALISYQEKLTDQKAKRYTAFILLGYYVPVFLGLFVTTILSAIFHIPLTPLGNLFVSLGVIFVAYSLLEYKSISFGPINYTTAVFDTMSEAVIVLSPTYTVEFINKAGETLLQQTSNHLVSQELSQLFSPETYATIRTTLLNLLQQRPFAHIDEVTLPLQNAKHISASITATKIQDEDKQSIGYVLILSDLSQVKTYQMSLEEKNHEVQKDNATLLSLQQQIQKEKQVIEERVSERTRIAAYEQQRLLNAINDLSLGFIMTNANKNVLLINKAIKDIFYLIYPEGSIALQDVQNHLRGINLNQQLDLAMQGKRAIRLLNVQADNRLVNIFVTPVIMSGLTQAEVAGAVILIENSMEPDSVQHAKEEFFTIASHELRTPLSAIRGYLSLIKQMYFDKLPDQQLKQMLSDMDVSSARLLTMINDFLDTSKLEQGRMDVKKEECDIIAIIQAAIKETQSIAIQKKLYLNLHAPASSVQVLGDKDRLKQITINLISNALRSTLQGGITITLDTENDTAVKVLVADTGKGIPEEGQRLLFQKFQQVSQSSYAKETGTGLGLYISKLLIEKMGGRIQLEKSEPGKGSTFSFTVPVFHS
jgi:signal transduction histidine kinase